MTMLHGPCPKDGSSAAYRIELNPRAGDSEWRRVGGGLRRDVGCDTIGWERPSRSPQPIHNVGGNKSNQA